MDLLQNLLSSFPRLSSEQLNALVALGGLAVAAFAIYAVLTIIKERGS